MTFAESGRSLMETRGESRGRRDYVKKRGDKRGISEK